MTAQPRRFFIALPVDDEKTVKSLNKVFRHLNNYSSSLKIVPAENYHITLKFFGQVEPGIAGSLAEAFPSLNNLKKVEYSIEGLGAFPAIDCPSVIWAGLKCDERPFEEILKSVENLSLSFGYPPEKRKFIPHLTLARVKREKDVPLELKKYLIQEKHVLFSSSVFHELVLFESILSRTGPEYKRIKTINL